jgi:hypothetical protein
MATTPNASAVSQGGSLDGPPNGGLQLVTEQLWFTLTTANNHTLMNKWLTVEETKYFSLQKKEKKASMTQQCRIIVKGAKHLPLQISSGPTIDFLMSTWMYCKRLEADHIPKEAKYQEVEAWMKNHVRELVNKAKMEKAQGKEPTPAGEAGKGKEGVGNDRRKNGDGEESSSSDDEDSKGVCLVRSRTTEGPQTPLRPGGQQGGQNKSTSSGNAASAAAGGGGGVGLWKLTMRPQTREEYANVEQLREQVRKNRTFVAMIATFLYTLILRYLPFDGYLLFLLALEVGVYYVGMNYKSLAKTLAKRSAKSRVNRIKDWFYFGVRRKAERADSDSDSEEEAPKKR